MDTHSLLRLAENICLLLALVLLFDVLGGRGNSGPSRVRSLFAGLGLGLIGICVMSIPWHPAPGVSIDARAVALSLSGLFFGVAPTVVAMAMTTAFRLLHGGTGMWAGVGLILMSGGAGLVWRELRRGSLADISWKELLLFGAVAQVALPLLPLLVLPHDIVDGVVRHTAVPMLLLFPSCTVLTGRFLACRLKRFRIEARLHEREEMFRKAFSDHMAVQLLIDPTTGAILNANKAAERFYGWSGEELTRMHIHEINELNPAQVASLMGLARTGAQTRFEFRHRLADGSTRFVEVFSSRLTVNGREILHSIIHDVTDKNQARAALMESEKRLNLAVNSTGLGLWDWDVATGRVVFNGNWPAMLGYAASEPPPADITALRAFCHADDLPAFDAGVRDHFEGRTDHFEHDLRVRRRDGDLIWVLVRGKIVERDEEGRPARMLGTMEDVTGRKRQQAAIEREVQRRKILMDNSNDGILIIDAAHRIVETNHRFAEMLGYAENELIGMYTWQYEAEMDEATVRKDFADLRTINAIIESRHRRRNGEIIDVEVSLSGSDVMGEGMVLAIVRDISERKQNQVALQREKERAEAANQTKSEFLANMSHEIRTPLNGILGMLQLLRSTDLNDEQGEYVRTAVESSKRLNRLLTDVLDLSRVEAGKLSLQSAPFDLTADLAQVCEMFELSNTAEGVELKCRVDPDVPAGLMGDSTRLVQILINLVGNAFKFTSNGTIEVEAVSLPPRRADAARVLFSVTDSGVGIARDKLDTLFSPFTQAHEGYTREFQGAGLGLSICKRLVELMGGAIHIDSTPGEGTMVFFTLDFDLAPDADDEKDRKRTLPTAVGRPLSILLAEDDRVNHIATKRLLEKEGHRVIGVETGRDAVDRLREGGCDLVLMDVQMPVMNGMDAARAIRAGEAGEDARNIPIIALTAYAMAEDMERILASGMDAYLTKPMALDELRTALVRIAG